MTTDYPGEQWKNVNFGLEHEYDFRLDISNFGRLKTFNRISNGKIIAGSMINGYRIVRIKLIRPRDEQAEQQFGYLQKQYENLSARLREMKKSGAEAAAIEESGALLSRLKQNMAKAYNKDLKERTVHYQSLVHRLVADYFLPKPVAGQTLVAHIDHDKLNNRASNLRWMTPEENYSHQKKSPHVIKEKEERKTRRKEDSKSTKLTTTRVMLLKKLLNEGKSVRQLAKTFKVTDTQIMRIKRGENWADVKAAE